MHVEIALSDEDRRALAAWAADCAERVLPLFEARRPDDPRPRAAIDGVRAYTLHGRRTARLRAVTWAAHAAAREADDPVAAAAARAASCAAAGPYTRALAMPHQVRHVLSPALYCARARELAAGGDPAAGEDEVRWAIRHASPGIHRIVGLLRHLDAGLRG
ncbi:MAG TPA: exonuclease SbcC [Dactylosporangium sp.]|jgi:hypothetical protein|nr:exonuclease SbcC [Dactylosporangium sp.]